MKIKASTHNGAHAPRNGNGRGVLDRIIAPDKEFRLASALTDVLTPAGTVVYRLWVGFVYDPDQSVNGLALGVIEGLTDNAKFPNLPYTVEH